MKSAAETARGEVEPTKLPELNAPVPSPVRMFVVHGPARAAARSMSESLLKSAAQIETGSAPAVYSVSAPKLPAPFPRRIETVPCLFATAISGKPSSLKSAVHAATEFTPVRKSISELKQS